MSVCALLVSAAGYEQAKGCLAGAPLLTEDDESTKVELSSSDHLTDRDGVKGHASQSQVAGVFLVGPAVRHGEHSFCFVYK